MIINWLFFGTICEFNIIFKNWIKYDCVVWWWDGVMRIFPGAKYLIKLTRHSTWQSHVCVFIIYGSWSENRNKDVRFAGGEQASLYSNLMQTAQKLSVPKDSCSRFVKFWTHKLSLSIGRSRELQWAHIVSITKLTFFGSQLIDAEHYLGIIISLALKLLLTLNICYFYRLNVGVSCYRYLSNVSIFS